MTSASTRRGRLAIVVAWVFFCLPLLGEGVPYYRDILRTDWPMRLFIGNSLREGQLPQWYPFEGLGLPFIGNAEGLFRPFSLLYAVPVDTLTLIKVEIAACVLLGMLGFFFLARRLGASEPAATLGAIAFALCGYGSSLQDNLPYLYPYHLMPWVLWAAQRVLTEPRRWRWVTALGVLWAQVVLGGDPLGAILLGAGVVAMLVAEQRWRQIPSLLGAGALTAGLCLAWVLPAWSLFGESSRVDWKPDATTMSLRLARLPELLLGGAWTDQDLAFALKRALDGPELWAHSLFLGATVLLFSGLAITVGTRRARVWGLTAGLFLWASLGAAGGLHTVLRTLFPLLNSFRYPEKYVSMAVLSLCLTAALGVDVVLQAPWSALRPRLVRLAGATALGVSAVLLAVLGSPQSFFLPDGRDLALQWGLGALLTAVVFALGVVALRWSQVRPALAWLAPALVLGELLLANAQVRLLVPRAVVSAMPPFCRAAIASGAGVGRSRVWTQVTQFPAHHSNADATSWVSKTLNLLEPDVCALCNLEDLGTPNLSGTSSRWWRALHLVDRERLASLFNAGVSVVDAHSAPAERGTVLEQAGPWVLVRPAAAPRPRAYDAVARWVPTAEAALESLATLADGEATLEGPPQASTGLAHGRVEVVSYGADAVELDVELPEPRAIILNDLYAPGWTATLDDQEVPLFRANYLVRAVLSPAGRHHLRFSFTAPGLQLGLSLSGLALLAGLVLVLLDLRAARQR